AQLPVTREELFRQQGPKTIRLSTLSSILDDETRSEAVSALSREDALALMNEYIQKLTLNPNNIPARERFATVLAAQFGKANLAIEQLELLIGMADQPEQKIAEWLGQIAAW